jgi:hypothetical protein
MSRLAHKDNIKDTLLVLLNLFVALLLIGLMMAVIISYVILMSHIN